MFENLRDIWRRSSAVARAGLASGDSKYLPVPDAKFLTAAGGGAGGEDEAIAEAARRARILRGEPETEGTALPPGDAPGHPDREPKRPWWRRFGL